MVEVLHYRQECREARRCPARHVRHDVLVDPPVRSGYLQATRTARERYHQGADGWTRYVPSCLHSFTASRLSLSDGDLGSSEPSRVERAWSNADDGTDEILLSSDKTIAVIDGSGVLADPAGLDREELIRLAKKRVPVSNFDLSKLSKDGYLVRVEEQDVKLPCECP